MLILYDKAGKTDHKGLWDLLFVTITGTLLSVLFTTTLAYPMSRKNFKFSKILTFLVFFTMLFNGGVVPSYMMWSQFFT